MDHACSYNGIMQAFPNYKYYDSIICLNIHNNHTVVINGSLAVERVNEILFEQVHYSHTSIYQIFEDNNTGIPMGSQVSMNCTASTTNNALPVQIMWIRDGKRIVEDSAHSIDTTNLNSNLEITNFAQNDVGVYQCIFDTGIEVVTTRPFRLQTGE